MAASASSSSPPSSSSPSPSSSSSPQSSRLGVAAAGELESFDDLLRRQQEEDEERQRRQRVYVASNDGLLDVGSPSFRRERRRSSGEHTIVPDREQSSVDEASDGEGDLSGSVVTIRPSEQATSSANQGSATTPRKDVPEREQHESRWNGFHLWRAESYQRRVSLHQEAHQAQADVAQRRNRWEPFERTWDTIRAKVRSSLRDDDEHRPSHLKLAALTVVLAGSNVAWCLELGYGTPYLLSIGMSKTDTSLVWLAAPLSGLLVQPVVGVLSDLSVSSFRRRQFIIGSSLALALATITLAFSLPLASMLADVLHIGMADWDPVRKQARDQIHRFLAVVAFIALDVSVNGIQVSARALVFDQTPSSLHSRATAWASRMMHAGNIFGYMAGWCNFSDSVWLRWLGGDQFRKYAMVSMVIVCVCSTLTCICIDERAVQSPKKAIDEEGSMDNNAAHTVATAYQHSSSSEPSISESLQNALMHIWHTFRRLPRSVRRVCFVQLFANMAWFPFLFYATEWVIEVWRKEQEGKRMKGDTQERAERLGSFALLLFAVVSLFSAVVLPNIALASWTVPSSTSSSTSGAHSDESSEEESLLLPTQGRRAKNRAEPPRWRIALRTLWTIAMTILFVQMCICTFVASRSSTWAIALVASIGVPYAVSVWVPYALVMEAVREAEEGSSPFEFDGDWFSPERVRARRRGLLRRVREAGAVSSSSSGGALAGTTNVVGTSAADAVPTTSLGRARARVRAARALQDCGPLGSDDTRNGRSTAKTSKAPSLISRGTTVLGSASPTRLASYTGSVGDVIDEDAHPTDDSVGATVLGIHNMAIVVPQMLIALVSAIVLRSSSTTPDADVSWVLRLGGVAALFAAALTRFVPLSQTERVHLRDPATLRLVAHAVDSAPRRFDDEVSETSSEEGLQRVL